MKCLVTGYEGFIGSHLMAKLKKCGHDVIGSEYSKYVYHPNEISDLAKVNDIRHISADYLKGVDVVYHLGAASGSLWFGDMHSVEESVEINCVGTVHLLEECRKAGVKKFIMVSTGSVYAGMACPHKDNMILPRDAFNFYAATKIFDEYACKLYHKLYGMEVVIVRLSSVYGDSEESKTKLANVVSQFTWSMMEGKSPVLWGDGSQTRDLIFVDDVVDALIFAAEKLKGNAKTYNVGTGVETSFNDLIVKINGVLGTDIKPEYAAVGNQHVQKGAVMRQLFDVGKLAKKGWVAKVSLEEGIRRIVENIKLRDAMLSQASGCAEG
jgi:UDP-glucose 4-epimerase